jgi:hypothetical protein
MLPVVRYESAELYWRLFDCEVPVKHLVYNKVGLGSDGPGWYWLGLGRNPVWTQNASPEVR